MFSFQTYCKSIKALALTLLLSTPYSAFAEDTEIFSNTRIQSEPNLLVILDNSGSMTSLIDGTTETRMEALTSAFQTFISNPEVADVNVGLMAFSNGNQDPRPHGVSIPVSPIDDEVTPIMLSNLIPAAFSTGDNFGFFSLADDNLVDPLPTQTVRQYLPDVIGAWTASGGTPIVDALHEAALYFKGASPKWGATSAEQVNAAHPSSYVGSYLSTIETQFTGNTRVCTVEGNCGINCVAEMHESECAAGETSCFSGNNCFTETQTDNNYCNLGSIAECMLSDPSYDACTEQVNTNCSTTCTGGTDPENGFCLGTETTTCTDTTSYNCTSTVDVTSCDREKFRCEETADIKVTTGSALYKSPITNVCQTNTIILMSDGSPNSTTDEAETDAVREEVKTLIGRTTDCAGVAGQVVPPTDHNTLADGRCGPELVEHLATVDQSSSVDGDNTIKTYTVGFAVDDRPEAKAYLESLAASGDGKYYPANDEAGLAAAFMSILNDTAAVSRSFAAPVYTVDTDSLLAHSDDIYLPLFQNTDFPAWAGNLKKFKLNSSGIIVDKNGDPAFDTSGSLKPEALDYWTPTGAVAATDADPITSGGFANNLDPSTRNLLIDSSTSLIALSDANVTKTALGDTAMDDAEKTALLNYIRGYEDDGTTPRHAIGDILHSKPTFISYGASKKVLFFGTNEGFLHAIDAADASTGGTGGKEKFAFMPSSLLKNIDGQKTNNVLPSGGLSRIYGVDGSISAIIDDNNNNGSVDTADGDTATLVFGLRRGGSEYYALDVTNPDAPSLKWKITATGDFANLGETWSKPKHAKLRYVKSGTETLADVLVFGGGYDNRLDEEDPALRSSLASTKGNAVYIVDLETGAHIWSYGGAGSSLANSVPSDIRTLDMDGDGSIDRLYFGDTGGNIWRADLTAKDNEPGYTRYDIANNAQVSHFANLAGTATDKRMFFFEPDVSIFRSAGKEALIVAVGSGYRAHPLNTNISDRFYVLSDENVRNVPPTPHTALTDADLAEASTLGGDSFFPSKKGWYKDLTSGLGEKALASPLIFLSKITFTTFAVGDVSTTTFDENGCRVEGSNIAKAYVLDLMTAAPSVDLDGDGDVDTHDEATIVENGNILDTPQLVFNEPSNCTTEGCNHFVDLRVGNKDTPLIDKDTVGGNNDLGDSLQNMYWLSK